MVCQLLRPAVYMGATVCPLHSFSKLTSSSSPSSISWGKTPASPKQVKRLSRKLWILVLTFCLLQGPHYFLPGWSLSSTQTFVQNRISAASPNFSAVKDHSIVGSLLVSFFRDCEHDFLSKIFSEGKQIDTVAFSPGAGADAPVGMKFSVPGTGKKFLSVEAVCDEQTTPAQWKLHRLCRLCRLHKLCGLQRDLCWRHTCSSSRCYGHYCWCTMVLWVELGLVYLVHFVAIAMAGVTRFSWIHPWCPTSMEHW